MITVDQGDVKLIVGGWSLVDRQLIKI